MKFVEVVRAASWLCHTDARQVFDLPTLGLRFNS